MAKKKAKSSTKRPGSSARPQVVVIRNAGGAPTAHKPHRKRPRKSGSSRKPKHKKNPSVGTMAKRGFGVLGETGKIVRYGVVGLSAGWVSREVNQRVLQGRNTGLMGYLGQVVAGAVTVVAVRMLGTRADAVAAAAGVGMGVGFRILAEQANPVVGNMASPESGLGDAGTFQVGRQVAHAIQQRSQMRGLPQTGGAPVESRQAPARYQRPRLMQTMGAAA